MGMSSSPNNLHKLYKPFYLQLQLHSTFYNLQSPTIPFPFLPKKFFIQMEPNGTTIVAFSLCCATVVMLVVKLRSFGNHMDESREMKVKMLKYNKNFIFKFFTSASKMRK